MKSKYKAYQNSTSMPCPQRASRSLCSPERPEGRRPAARKKRMEYRKAKPYWQKRLEGREYDLVKFRNGYMPNAPAYSAVSRFSSFILFCTD